ncbi:hypothetical protein [Mitsuaria sp. 7]|uniref:hypothetical protein n=1 Tax=Mitsuaria sp. 7 TaxID=1658665 RepID=UPI0012F70822|nr:hypothetical protein [Mitsuaria sp. 7]
MSKPDPSTNNPARRRPADPFDRAALSGDEPAAGPADADVTPETPATLPTAEALIPDLRAQIPASSLFGETSRRQAAQLIDAIAALPPSAADATAGSPPPEDIPPTLAPPN